MSAPVVGGSWNMSHVIAGSITMIEAIDATHIIHMFFTAWIQSIYPAMRSAPQTVISANAFRKIGSIAEFPTAWSFAATTSAYIENVSPAKIATIAQIFKKSGVIKKSYFQISYQTPT